MTSLPISPVMDVPGDNEPQLQEGIALCLFGAGYRVPLSGGV
jgi:hypothetical protein